MHILTKKKDEIVPPYIVFWDISFVKFIHDPQSRLMTMSRTYTISKLFDWPAMHTCSCSQGQQKLDLLMLQTCIMFIFFFTAYNFAFLSTSVVSVAVGKEINIVCRYRVVFLIQEIHDVPHEVSFRCELSGYGPCVWCQCIKNPR